jgi:hypothetical protein
MTDELIRHEGLIRAVAFGATLLAVAIAQRLCPLRRDAHLDRRTATNLLMVLIDTLLVRVAFPLLAVGAAVLAAERGLGLLNLVAWPYWLEFALSLLLLDLAIYWQHRLLTSSPCSGACTACTTATSRSTPPRACASIRSRSPCRWGSSSR